MATNTTTGGETRVHYLHEDNGFDASPTDSTAKAFGANARLTTHEGRNEVERVLVPGSRDPVDAITTKFEGRFTVEFTLTNPWWLDHVIEAAASTTGTGPYTHTWDGENPESLQITEGLENGSDERVVSGAIPTSATISATTGETATITLEGAYANETLNENVTLTAQPTLDYDPLTFAHADLSLDGTSLSLVQEAELTIENNADPIPALGSRKAVDYSPKQREVDVRFTKIKLADVDQLQDFYGGSTATTPDSTGLGTRKAMTFTFDNGESGTAVNKIVFSIAGTVPDTYEWSGVGDPTSEVEEIINRIATGISASAENNDSSTK